MALIPVVNMVQRTCFYYMLLYVFSINAGAMMIVMVDLDRLLALIAATRLGKSEKASL